jgi:hypothetical protein
MSIIGDSVNASGLRLDSNGSAYTTNGIARLMESMGISGLWLANFDAWAARLCGVVATACLVGMGHAAVGLIGPVVQGGPSCASSAEGATQTVNPPR